MVSGAGGIFKNISHNGRVFMSVIFLPKLKIKEEKNYCINTLLAAVAYDNLNTKRKKIK